MALEISTGMEQLNHYGCYDRICCTKAIDLIKSKSIYLAILACAVLAAFFCAALGSFKIYNDLDEGHEKGVKVKDLWSKSNIVIIILFVIFIGVIGYAFVTMPKKPDVVPYEPEPAPKPDEKINRIIIPDIITKRNETERSKNETKKTDEEFKNQTQIVEKKEGCGDTCPTMRYKVNLSTEDGIFERNKNADFKKIVVSEERSENFSGGKRYRVEFFYRYIS